MKTIELVYGQGAVVAAKNIRIELKKNFPGVSFSVRSSSFSGGTAIDVRWVDGPTTAQVNEIIKKYQYGEFNGMDDIYEYKSDRTFTSSHGSAKYVHASRELSPEFRAKIENKIAQDYGRPFSANETYCGRFGSDLVYQYSSEMNG